jgi:hypothetical protein
MADFDFSGRSTGSGTYRDSNRVLWIIFKDADDELLNDNHWTAQPADGARSLYGVVDQWGPRNTMKARIDAYAAGYAVVPPASSGDSSWIWIVVAAVVLMGDGPQR